MAAQKHERTFVVNTQNAAMSIGTQFVGNVNRCRPMFATKEMCRVDSQFCFDSTERAVFIYNLQLFQTCEEQIIRIACRARIEVIVFRIQHITDIIYFYRNRFTDNFRSRATRNHFAHGKFTSLQIVGRQTVDVLLVSLGTFIVKFICMITMI